MLTYAEVVLRQIYPGIKAVHNGTVMDNLEQKNWPALVPYKAAVETEEGCSVQSFMNLVPGPNISPLPIRKSGWKAIPGGKLLGGGKSHQEKPSFIHFKDTFRKV